MSLGRKLAITGLAALMVYGGFKLGKKHSKTEKQDVLEYIDTHKEERREIYLHTRSYLLENDSLYLDSLISKKKREEITLDYLSDPKNYLEINSKLVERDLKKWGEKAKKVYETLKE
jgi:hypothetical protein